MTPFAHHELRTGECLTMGHENTPPTAPSDLVQHAMTLAERLHKDQTDKAGEPYLGHLLRVMEGVRAEGEVAMAAALLHDSIEDAGVTAELLQQWGIPRSVVTVVEALTKRSGEDYDAFVERVVQAGPTAMAVKMSDLRDNMNLSRRKAVTEKDRARVEKYRQAYARLEAALGDVRGGLVTTQLGCLVPTGWGVSR